MKRKTGLMLPVRVRFALTSTKCYRTATFKDGEAEPTRIISGECALEEGVTLTHFSEEGRSDASFSTYQFEISASEAESYFAFYDEAGCVLFKLAIGPGRLARIWNELLSRPTARLVLHIEAVGHAENAELRMAHSDRIYEFKEPDPGFTFVKIEAVDLTVIDEVLAPTPAKTLRWGGLKIRL